MGLTSVSEIHRYPLRPEGFEEPLFSTGASRRAVGEHLLGAPWLRRASELRRGTGETVHAVREPVEVRRCCYGVELYRQGGRGCGSRRRRVAEVFGRWREVRGWWVEGGGVDRIVARVLLSGDAVVDLCRGPSGGCALVGAVD